MTVIGNLACLRTTQSKCVFLFIFSAYGMIADIDIESEIIHGMGSIRFAIFALLRTINLRSYKVKLWYRKYVPPEALNEDNEIASETENNDNQEQTTEGTESSGDRGNNQL